MGYGRIDIFLLETFELGLGRCTMIKDFCEKIKLLSNSPTILAFGDIHYRADEIMEFRANISKSQRLGWSPNFSVFEVLEVIFNEYDGNFHD